MKDYENFSVWYRLPADDIKKKGTEHCIRELKGKAAIMLAEKIIDEKLVGVDMEKNIPHNSVDFYFTVSVNVPHTSNR